MKSRVARTNTGYLPVDDHINAIQNLATDRLVMKESGYLEVFVNNQAQTPVYYDNLRVSHSACSVLEVNAYYPYGKIITGLSEISTYAKNQYKYNGGEYIEDLDLRCTDLGHRPIPEDLPVYPTPDRFCESFYHLSPYSFAAGNPMRVIDVNGDWIIIFNENGIFLFGFDEDDDENDEIRIMSQNAWDDLKSRYGDEMSKYNGEFFGEFMNASNGMEETQLTTKAYSEMFTYILSLMPDVDVSKLHNEKVSVYNPNAMRGYNDPDTSIDITASIGPYRGKLRLTASIDSYTMPLYSTVSNVQNLLGVHEFIGHGTNGLDDKSQHYEVYQLQKEHSTWCKTTQAFKKHVEDNQKKSKK